MNTNNNDIMIYEDKDGITRVNVKFIDEDIWLTKYHIADFYAKKELEKGFASVSINCLITISAATYKKLINIMNDLKVRLLWIRI